MATASPRAERGTTLVSRRRWLAVLALMLLAANLRTPLTEVGPVLPRIQVDFGLGGAQASLLTALPVLFFGLCAPTVPFLLRRLGIDRTVLAALSVLLAGSLLRLVPSWAALLAGTVLLGSAIAVGNVMLPVLVKTRFAARSGAMTGLYTMSLNIAASAAAGTIVPLVAWTGQGWRAGFGFWLIPIGVAIACWTLVARTGPGHVPGQAGSMPTFALLRSGRARALVVFTASQSIVYYGMIAWLPSIFQNSGTSASTSGALLSAATFVGAPVALLLPTLAVRARSQVGHAVALAVFAAIGLVGLLVAPLAAPYVWAIMLGIGQGGVFPLALTLFVLRTTSPQQTAGLSVLAQSVAYLCAAVGPFAMGLLHDHTGSWSAAIWVLLGALVIEAVSGVSAGRPGHLWRAADPPSADPPPAERATTKHPGPLPQQATPPFRDKGES